MKTPLARGVRKDPSGVLWTSDFFWLLQDNRRLQDALILQEKIQRYKDLGLTDEFLIPIMEYGEVTQ